MIYNTTLEVEYLWAAGKVQVLDPSFLFQIQLIYYPSQGNYC